MDSNDNNEATVGPPDACDVPLPMDTNNDPTDGQEGASSVSLEMLPSVTAGHIGDPQTVNVEPLEPSGTNHESVDEPPAESDDLQIMGHVDMSIQPNEAPLSVNPELVEVPTVFSSESLKDVDPQTLGLMGISVEPKDTPQALSGNPGAMEMSTRVSSEPLENVDPQTLGPVSVNVEFHNAPLALSVNPGAVEMSPGLGSEPLENFHLQTTDRASVVFHEPPQTLSVNAEAVEIIPGVNGVPLGVEAGESHKPVEFAPAESVESHQIHADPSTRDALNYEYSKFAGEIGMDRYPGSTLRFDYKNYQNAYDEYYATHEQERINFDNVNVDSPYGYGSGSAFHGFTWNEAHPMSGSLGMDGKPRSAETGENSATQPVANTGASQPKTATVKKGVPALNFVKAGTDFKSTVVHVEEDPKLMVPASVINNRKGIGFLSKKDKKQINQENKQKQEEKIINRANKPIVNLIPESVASLISGTISDQKFCNFARVARRKQVPGRNAIQVIHLAKDQCRMIINDDVNTGPRARNGMASFICVLKVDGMIVGEGTAMNKKKAKHEAYDNAMQLFQNEELTVKEVNGEHKLVKKEGSAVAKQPVPSGPPGVKGVGAQGGKAVGPQTGKGNVSQSAAQKQTSSFSAEAKATESTVKEQYAKPKIVFRQPKPSANPQADRPLQFLNKKPGCSTTKVESGDPKQTNQKRAEALTDKLLASVMDSVTGKEKEKSGDAMDLEPGEIVESTERPRFKPPESVAFVDNRVPKVRPVRYGGPQLNMEAKRMITNSLPVRYGGNRFQNPRGNFQRGHPRAMVNQPISFQKGGVYIEEEPQGENVVDMRKPCQIQEEANAPQGVWKPASGPEKPGSASQPTRSFTGPLRPEPPKQEQGPTVLPKFTPRHFQKGQESAGRSSKRNLEDGELDEPLSSAQFKRRKSKVGINDLSEFIVLDYSRVNPSTNATSMLHMSANFNKVLMKYEYTYTDNGFRTGWSCCLLINDETTAKVTRDTKEEAKTSCSEDALAYLRKFCYSIIVKQAVDNDVSGLSKDSVLSDIQRGGSEMLPDTNVGNMLLRKMGWEGGGVGKHGTGISEPIKTEMVIGRQGLGGTVKGNFPQQANKLLADYVKSEDQKDLHFNAEFTKEERAILHKAGQRLGLKTQSRGKEPDRYLCVSRKRTPYQLLDHVMSSGGSTNKYEVLQPTDPEAYERKQKHSVLAYGHSKQ